MSPGSLLFTVIKGAVYSLVAVSMNLLNGFTGLFSLGQAGFMLLGAYAYAIFMIPESAREGDITSSAGRASTSRFGDVPAPVRREQLRRRAEPGARRAGRHHLCGAGRGALCVSDRSAGAETQERLSGHRHARLPRSCAPSSSGRRSARSPTARTSSRAIRRLPTSTSPTPPEGSSSA